MGNNKLIKILGVSAAIVITALIIGLAIVSPYEQVAVPEGPGFNFEELSVEQRETILEQLSKAPPSESEQILETLAPDSSDEASGFTKEERNRILDALQ